ncbi:MAG TPA: hypothetical protein VN864_07115 [Thermoplasmata archaeon]|nr:hypothetical protein [Thermoplasmata archaeon]
MTIWNEEKVGYALGLVGGVLFLLAAAVTWLTGSVDLVLGRTYGAFNAWSDALVLAVLGGLAILFSHLGYTVWRERALSAAVLLIVVAFLAAVVLAPGMGVLAVLGAVLVALAGVLYLLEPMKRAAHTVVAA